MNGVVEVVVPQLGVNDDRVRVAEWRIHAGEHVDRGTVIAELETTKASVELESESEGFCYPLVEAGGEAPIRATIALILSTQDPDAIAQYLASRPRKAAGSTGPKATIKARKVAQELGIDLETIVVSGIIREEDVRRAAGLTGSDQRLSPAQQGNVAIYGASQGGAVVAEALRSMGRYTPVAFLDDNSALGSADYEGLPVWPGSALEDLPKRGIVGFATHIAKASSRRNLLARAEAAGIPMLNVIHAGAKVSPAASMGTGNLVKAGAIVDDFVVIEDCCIVDNGAVVPHHCRLASGVHLAPGVVMGGDCDIGENTIVGVGACIAPRVRIGSNVIIGVGAVLTRDVPDGVIVEGPSARIVGTRKA